MASKGNSIAAVAARALGIKLKHLPERLRTDLYAYTLRDKKIKVRLLGEPDAIGYTSIPSGKGNKNYIRNLVILNTLFEDKKIVLGWLNGSGLSKDKLQEHLAEWRAKKMLYQALESRLPELDRFFSKDDINWAEDEIPYPFSEGEFSSVELITDSIAADNTPSPYDSALSALLNRKYEKLGQILTESSDAFINGDGQWLNQLYQARHQEVSDYRALLNKY